MPMHTELVIAPLESAPLPRLCHPHLRRWLLFNAAQCVPSILSALAAPAGRTSTSALEGSPDDAPAREVAEAMLGGMVESVLRTGGTNALGLPDVQQVSCTRG